MNLELMETDDLPKGHDWAVVRLPERVVLLMRESVAAKVDHEAVNEALRRAS